MSMTAAKWISVPVLLIGSLFAPLTRGYEIVSNLFVFAAVLLVVHRAVCNREYLWAAAFGGVAIVFSPFTLVIKILLLLSFASLGALAGVYADWKPQPLESM